MQKLIAIATAITMAGCAVAPPNTPGAGSGDTYTPFIDMQGLDKARYLNDLAGCRSYAQQIDPGKQAMAGMIGGILLGALVGAAIGRNRHTVEHGALAGGGAGVAGGGARAVVKQETIVANCMAGRGYRVLEGATVLTNTSAPSPYNNAAAFPPPAAAMQMQSRPPVQTTAVASSLVVGEDSRAVEKMALAQACSPQPIANRTATGPGYDAYTVACSNGSKLTVRCEFGTCRIAQ